MKVLVWEDKDNAVGHGGSLRTIILNMCPQLADIDVVVGYIGVTDPAFPSWAVSVTDAGYSTVSAYAAANGFGIVNRSYTSSTRMLDFEAAGVPIVHACTGEVGAGPGWCCFVGRDYFDMSISSVASGALDFKIQHDGTLSAATATVTGHIVNLLYNRPTWNFFDARQALRQTAGDYATGWTRVRGYGYVDYAAALLVEDVALAVPCPGDLRATVNNADPAVAVYWSNLPALAAGFVSTRLVLFAALPDSDTPIASGTVLYDGSALDYVWDSASPVAPAVGTHYLAVYAVDDAAATSRLEEYGPLTTVVAVVVPRYWYVDNELVAGAHDGLSWETAFTAFDDARAVSVAGDYVYIKATDTPYKVGSSLCRAAATYGDATGNGTERGTKRAVFIGLNTLIDMASLVPDDTYPSLCSFGGSTAAVVALHDGKKMIRLLDRVLQLADCLATPGSWCYDSVTHKNFLNPTGLSLEYLLAWAGGDSYARSYGGILAGVDWLFHLPGAAYSYLEGTDALFEDLSVGYCRSGPYAYASGSLYGITMRRVKAHHIGGLVTSEAFDITSRSSAAAARIRLEYCLAEDTGLGFGPALGFSVAHSETAVYAHNGVEMVHCTARRCSGGGFKQTGANGKLLVQSCHGMDNSQAGAADFDRQVSTATVTCVDNRAGSVIPYAGTWEANKGTGAAESNEIELLAAPVAGMHDQATPAKDVNGKVVYTIPDIGAVQVSGPLYFDAAAPAGGNGTRWRPFNALSNYLFAGDNFRDGGELVFAGVLGALDLTGCTDTGVKTIMPWPKRPGSIAGLAGGENVVFSVGPSAGRGLFTPIWKGGGMADDGRWRNFSTAAVDFTALPDAALHEGRVMRCKPLVAGQNCWWVESDGTFWRPMGGRQVIFNLADDLQSTTETGLQLLLSIPLPAKLLPDMRSGLFTTIGIDKVGGTADTLAVYQRLGPLGATTDPLLFQSTLTTTNISGGMTNQCARVSATSVRKVGAAGVAGNTSISGISATVRGAAITVGDLDSVTNYLSLVSNLTTGGLGENGVIHAFTVELAG